MLLDQYKSYLQILSEQYNSKSQLIFESIHRLNSYQRLYSYIKNSDKFTFSFNLKDFLQFFPLQSSQYKVLKRNLKKHIKLSISVCNFNNQLQVINSLKFFVKDADQELINTVKQRVCEEYQPCVIKDNKYQILMFLPKQFNIYDLRHQFIHFLQFVHPKQTDGKVLQVSLYDDQQQNDDYLNTTVLEYFKKNFNVDDDTIKYFQVLAQYEPILNDTFDQLRLFKQKNYQYMTDSDFASLMFKLLFNHYQSLTQYLNRILSYDYIQELKDFQNYGVCLIIYFNLIGYKVEQLKDLLFEYFS